MLLSAATAKQMVDDNINNNFEKAIDYINEIIDFAIKDNRYYCLIELHNLTEIGLSDNQIKDVIEDIKQAGYHLEYCENGTGTMKLDWFFPEDCVSKPRWIKRHRFDGEIFYECGNCRSVAMGERKEECPNCKCKMGGSG